jgi:hypothetical protein
MADPIGAAASDRRSSRSRPACIGFEQTVRACGEAECLRHHNPLPLRRIDIKGIAQTLVDFGEARMFI